MLFSQPVSVTISTRNCWGSIYWLLKGSSSELWMIPCTQFGIEFVPFYGSYTHIPIFLFSNILLMPLSFNITIPTWWNVAYAVKHNYHSLLQLNLNIWWHWQKWREFRRPEDIGGLLTAFWVKFPQFNLIFLSPIKARKYHGNL